MFEGLCVPTMVDLDDYLQQQYGDIQIDPPANEQLPSHTGNDQYIFDFYNTY